MFVDRNSVLQQIFQREHLRVVNSVNAANIIDFLFQELILGKEEMRALHQKSDPQQQCRDLLALLHTSDNPVTFIKLYDAIKNDEPHLQWLIELIDDYSDHLEQQQPSDQTGQCQSISQISSFNKFSIIVATTFK